MNFVAHRRRVWLLAVVLAVAALLYFGDASRAARFTPRGQPTLVWLSTANVATFANRFDAAAGGTRVVLFFSPT